MVDPALFGTALLALGGALFGFFVFYWLGFTLPNRLLDLLRRVGLFDRLLRLPRRVQAA